MRAVRRRVHGGVGTFRATWCSRDKKKRPVMTTASRWSENRRREAKILTGVSQPREADRGGAAAGREEEDDVPGDSSGEVRRERV